MKRYDIHIERVVVGNGASYAKTVPHENPYGDYVLYSDVQSLQAERDTERNARRKAWDKIDEILAERDGLMEVLDIGKEAESLFVELTSDGRLDIRTEAAMELCEVFQRFQDARRALEGEKG